MVVVGRSTAGNQFTSEPGVALDNTNGLVLGTFQGFFTLTETNVETFAPSNSFSSGQSVVTGDFIPAGIKIPIPFSSIKLTSGSIFAVGTPTPWTLASDEDLSLLLDPSNASSITLNNSNVVDIADLSGNNRNFAQGTPSKQPAYGAVVQNGREMISFNGTTDFLWRSDEWIYSAGAHSIIMVVKAPSQINKRLFSTGSSANNTPFYSPISSSSTTGSNLGVSYRTDSSSSPLLITADRGLAWDDTAKIITVIDTGANFTTRINGVQTNTENYTRGATTLDRTAIGALLRAAESTHMQADVGVVLASDNIDLVTVLKHEGLLASQWDIALDSSHKYANELP